MAFLSALLSLLSRKLGDLLQAVFGWSITGLFGRLPRAKQTGLSVALILSLLWPLLVVGAFAPKVAAWALAFLPLHQWLGDGALRALWIGLAVLAPLGVGALTSWVAPSRRQKGGVLLTLLLGFPLTLGFALAFLITLLVVPALKVAAMARGWDDQHVYVQVKPGAYRAVLADLRSACENAALHVVERPVPWLMALPTRILRWFSRGGLEPIVAEDPRMLRGEAVEIYLYPADLLLRGKSQPIARVRAAMVRELNQSPAYLAADPKAQHIEDEIGRMWQVVARHSGPEEMGALAHGRVREIARELDRAQVPFDDWTTLYSNLHHLERAVCGGPRLVDPEPPQRTGEGAMVERDDIPEDVSTVDLVKTAIDEARELFKTEFALAKDELRREMTGVKVSAISFSATAVLAVLGVSMLLIAWALAFFPNPIPSLIAGAVLLVGAGIAAFVGYRAVPKKPLEATKARLETDVQVLKERLA